jgi:hypothetical protein
MCFCEPQPMCVVLLHHCTDLAVVCLDDADTPQFAVLYSCRRPEAPYAARRLRGTIPSLFKRAEARRSVVGGAVPLLQMYSNSSH